MLLLVSYLELTPDTKGRKTRNLTFTLILARRARIESSKGFQEGVKSKIIGRSEGVKLKIILH
jgi:hypothetical protein